MWGKQLILQFSQKQSQPVETERPVFGFADCKTKSKNVFTIQRLRKHAFLRAGHVRQKE